MDSKTSNKRKSLIVTKVIPNKRRKIVNTTASLKTNNKSSKPTNRTIKKQKPDDKYIKFKEDRKPKKIYEKTELTDESEEYETNHSIEKINGNNSLYDSNNEESEIEETDSGRYLEVEEEGSSDEEVKNDAGASSDEETEINEETNSVVEESNSDEELEIIEVDGNSNEQIAVNKEANLDDELENDEEANSDEELEIDEKANSDDELENDEEANSDEELEIDEKANSDDELENDEEANSDEELEIDEKANSDDELENDEGANSNEELEIDEKANSDDELENDEGANSNEELEIDEKANSEDEFEANEDTNVSDDSDEEVKNNEDLDKDAEELDEQDEDNQYEIIDNKFKVKNFSVLVRGIKRKEDIKKFFQDCRIMYFDVFASHKKGQPGRAFVYFEDEISREIALKKDGMKFKGNVIELERLIKSSTKLTVEVSGIDPAVRVYNIFPDSEIEYYKRDSTDISKAVVYFKDKKSVAKALSKNNTKINNFTLTVKKYKKPTVIKTKSVRIESLNQNIKILDIFNDCKITSSRIGGSHTFVTFADKKSLEKALLKDKTEHDGYLIRVFRTDCTVVFEGAIPESKVKDVFDGCNIQTYKILNNIRRFYTGKIFINFQDIRSVMRAIKKDRTECGGRIILVQQKIKSFETKKPFIPKHQGGFGQSSSKKSFTPKNQGVFKQTSFKKSFTPKNQGVFGQSPFKKSFTPRNLGGFGQTPFKKSFTSKNQDDFKQTSIKKSSSLKGPNNLEQNFLLLDQMQSQIATLERRIFEQIKSIKKQRTDKKSVSRK